MFGGMFRRNVNSRDEEGLAPLDRAAINGDEREAHSLIKKGADIDARISIGEETALHLASRFGSYAVAKVLVENDADIGARNVQGSTPLHQAALWNHADIVALLVENGAELNTTTESGSTPLVEAVRADAVECVRILIESRADVYEGDPLGLAKEIGNDEIAALLTEAGAVTSR